MTNEALAQTDETYRENGQGSSHRGADEKSLLDEVARRFRRGFLTFMAGTCFSEEGAKS